MDSERIRLSQRNPRYWRYDGEPTLLLGASSEDNLFQVPDVEGELARLAAAGGNYVRCTMSSREHFAVWPFAEVGDGVYDLERWNDEYWERFDAFLEAAYENDVVVQIELWAIFDFHAERDRVDDRRWSANPFNPENNRNYSAETAELLDCTPNTSPTLLDNPFFWSVPALGNLTEVLDYQRRFVDNVLSHALSYPNVLYCMDNETHAARAWGEYWAEYVRQRAHRRGHLVQVTEMYRIEDIRNPQHWAVYDHPETYSFCDISQNSTEVGRTHWERIQWVRARLDPPRPLTNVKIYGTDDVEWFGSARDGIERFWRNVIGGCASARFHRPPGGIGASDEALRNVQAAREVTDAVDLLSCEPSDELLDDCEPNEAYVTADPGDAYLVYFPDGGAVDLSIGGVSTCSWYDVDAVEWAGDDSVSGPSQRLETPDSGQWVAVVR